MPWTTPTRHVCERSTGACQPPLTRTGRRPRLERETGIEPATNSLEGCDSTTELLPPSCSVLQQARPPHHAPCLTPRPLPYSPGPHASLCLLQYPPVEPPTRPRAHSLLERARRDPLAASGLQQSALGIREPASRCPAMQAERGLMARGGFEPPKPLGRQIYSLLRLTAPQPRRLMIGRAPACVWIRAVGIDKTRENRRVTPFETWSWRRDSNPRPADYKSAALPD